MQMALFTSIRMKAAGLAIVVCGTGLVMFVGHQVQEEKSQGTIAAATAPVIHTADWYVAHPGVLKVDEHRCAGDASSMTPAACQNAASADARLTVLQMQNAAAANGAASTSNPTPKSLQ